jgi:hypothetical protein
MPLPEEAQNSINNIVKSIKRGVVIPIIGYEMLFNEFDRENNENDFLKLLIKRHAEKNASVELKKNVLKKEKGLSGYELVNFYYHNMPSEESDNFKMALSDTIKNERIDWQIVPESFRKLVSIKYFNFFINCTFTNSLELAFNRFRADGKSQDERKSSYTVLGYDVNHPGTVPNLPTKQFTKIEIDKPLIYNLFGTHENNPDTYLLTDADYIELIYDLIKNESGNFTNFVSYLNNADLLFLGCNFPDWFFRFFIRVCVGNRLDRAPKKLIKTVIDSLNKPDENRSIFIKNYKIQMLNLDCITLINEIYKSLSNDVEHSNILSDKGNNKVFISYCKADEQIAKDIASQFDSKFIEYFLDDNNLRGGDDLNTKVTNAIDKCCIFLSIVSSNVQKAKPYVWKEWAYALSKPIEIWPVFKGDFDKDMLLSPEYHVTLELRDKILNNYGTIGIVLEKGTDSTDIEKRGNKITENKLVELKEKQFYSQVSGSK